MKLSKIFLKSHQLTTSQNIDVVLQEMFKMFTNQTSLKKLDICNSHLNTSFITYPGAMDCLRNLLKFNCGTNVDSEFFHQMSQICHNIQSLYIQKFLKDYWI